MSTGLQNRKTAPPRAPAAQWASVWASVWAAAVVWVALVSSCTVAHAQTEQLGFIGVAGPAGSMSAQGANDTVVYLRWENFEGDIPADWQGFRIVRDGVDITAGTIPAFGVMSSAEIDGLYADMVHDRRAAEMVAWLDELREDETVSMTDLGAVVAEQIASDRFWSTAAARIDVNVARAQYRAFIDPNPYSNHEYGLWVDTAVATYEIARVQVPFTSPEPALAPASFRAVPANELARCDAPEDAKAHGVIALTWEYPTSTPMDQLRYTMQVPGFDIYRTEQPVASLPTIDIRTLAKALNHDSLGRVNIPGLVKVNDQPVTISGTPDTELGYEGWAPTWFHHVETARELAAQGVTPGQTYGYFVVPRDFTGNYGHTAGALVEIPDLVKPPAPWRVRSYPRTQIAHGADELLLRWPHVNVANFVSDRANGRTLCNLGAAAAEQRLRFASTAGCGPDEAVSEYNLQVADYLVYRFDSVAQARGFADSDGDGYGDLDERQGNAADPTLACDPTDHPPGAASYLVAIVDATDAVERSTGRREMEFVDTTPGQNLNKVFWYRLVARTASGQLSPMSAPARGHIPDYATPARAPGGDMVLGHCDWNVTMEPTEYPYIAYDPSSVAQFAKISCHHPSYGPRVETYVLHNVGGGATGALDSAGRCASLATACENQDITVTYFDADGRPLASGERKNWNKDCVQLASILHEDCNKIIPLDPGTSVPGGLVFDVPGFVPGEQCVDLFREINGTRYRLETICDDVFPMELQPATFGAATVCLSAAIVDSNGRSNPSTRLPCFRAGFTKPEPPQPLGFEFFSVSLTGTIQWVMPPQGGAGIIAEWFLADGSQRQSRFIVADDSNQTLLGHFAEVEVGMPPDFGDTQHFCFRARTVVAQGGPPEESLSEWSERVCTVRGGIGSELPQYLPWPEPRGPAEGADRSAEYLVEDGVPVIRFGVLADDFSCLPTMVACNPDVESCIQSKFVMPGEFCNACQQLQAVVGPDLGFVLYRQSRQNVGDTPGEFHQVTPLIDRMHCEFAPSEKDDSYVLDDPYFAVIRVPGVPAGGGAEVPQYQLVLPDRFPHESQREYRYEIVWFDANGGISRFAHTNWVRALEAE